MEKFYISYNYEECCDCAFFKDKFVAKKYCERMTEFTGYEYKYFSIELPSPYVVLANDGAKADIKVEE